MSVLLGDGAGGFAAATGFPAGDFQVSVAIADLDGDGNQDLAVANFYSDTVSVLLGDGAGGFAAATGFPAGDEPQSVAIADLDGDGNQDLVVANGGSGDVSVLLGDGAGGFAAATGFPAGDYPVSVAIADLDGDGHRDLAVANYNTNNVSVFVNTTNRAPLASDDSYTTAEDTALTVAASGVLGSDTDPDGDPLTAARVAGPSHGTLTLNPNGSFSYTPAANYTGSDSFTYRVTDGTVDSNVATVSITVTAVNDAPTVTVAAGGSCAGNDRAGTINLTVADVETAATGLTLTAASGNEEPLRPDLTLAGSGAPAP